MPRKPADQTRHVLRAQEILERIGTLELTRTEIAEMMHCSPAVAQTAMALLRKQKRLYICRYLLREGPALPYYKAGNKNDVKQPTRRDAIDKAALKICRALRKSDLNALQLRALPGLQEFHIVRALQRLRKNKRIHVCEIKWKLRIYRYGPGVDVVPPRRPKRAPVQASRPMADPLLAALFQK